MSEEAPLRDDAIIAEIKLSMEEMDRRFHEAKEAVISINDAENDYDHEIRIIRTVTEIRDLCFLLESIADDLSAISMDDEDA